MTIKNLLTLRAQERPDAPALMAPGRYALAYSGLLQEMDSVSRELRAAGLGRQDRVAIVLPNGPEMATALLAVMSAAVCAPLSPQYSKQEFDFFLSDLDAKAVLVAAGSDSPVLASARRFRLPIIELVPETASPDRYFHLVSGGSSKSLADEPPAPDDTALLLHTSGTTSRPKLVALSQANLAHSARNIAASLNLAPADRCLNIMPLFHVHGMVGALLATLVSGGSVVCSPGCFPSDFFNWLMEFSPTWYTAVPTMHQRLLSRATEYPDVIRSRPLRFIRSCSASLAPPLMAELEIVFRAPVVEAYGMTEASHQVACNPLPLRQRKPGSVGLPAGTEIAIMNKRGELLAAGERGEVVIRGPAVMAGYENNPEANAQSFFGGWFRTEDQGFRDQDGYLFLTARLKEIINRGGEKIAPREVDEVLITHPAVAQAVTFGYPDPRLGEDVAAAVVLRPGSVTNAEDIRAFAAQRLAPHKVPRRVVLVQEIPKGPTGKLQRIGLADKLGLSAISPAAPAVNAFSRRPATELEKRLENLWSEILGKPLRSTADEFFQSGGDSLLAARLLELIRAEFGKAIPMSSFILKPTFDSLAGILSDVKTVSASSIVPIQPNGRRPPLFCVHPHDGQVFLYYNLARYMDPEQPVYAFQGAESFMDGRSRPRPDVLAADYVRDLLAFPVSGPYFLAGYCSGAPVALEMARRLQEQGRAVGLLVIMDGYAPGYPRPKPGTGRLALSVFSLLDRLRRLAAFVAYVSAAKRGWRAAILKSRLAGEAGALLSVFKPLPRRSDESGSFRGFGGWPESEYNPAPYAGSVLLLRPSREPLGFRPEPSLGWDGLIQEGLCVVTMRGYFRTLIYPPWVRRLSGVLDSWLKKAQES